MLGATKTGATVHKISTPPKPHELTIQGLRDWKSGVELVKTCMRTHDTATFVTYSLEYLAQRAELGCSGLAPEIVHFRIPSDGMEINAQAPMDWYIKGAK